MDEKLTAHESSEEASIKAKEAQEAVEKARETQLQEAIRKTAVETKAALLEGLKEVFDYGDANESGEMKVLVRRIPLICQDVKQIHSDIASINDNLKWGVRIVLGAVFVALLKLIFVP